MTERRDEDKKHWASLPGEKLIEKLVKRRDNFWRLLEDHNIVDAVYTYWRMYHNLFYDWRGDRIVAGGADGDIAQLGVADFRSFINTILSYTLAKAPDWDAQATETSDAASDATRLANQALDWVMDAPQYLMEEGLRRAAEECLIYKVAHMATIYDEMAGEQTGGDKETGQLKYRGDLHIFNPTLFDVVFDPYITDKKRRTWVFFRERRNRYDLAALYFKQREKILNLPGSENSDESKFHGMERGIARLEGEDDQLDLWYFFQMPTPAIEKGRLFIAAGNKDMIELVDKPLPKYYKRLPIHTLMHSEMLGSLIIGMSPADSLAPLQEAENIALTTIMTNIKKWGLSKIWGKEGEPVNIAELEAGMADLVQTNTKLEVLNLLQSMPELYQFFELVPGLMSRVTNVSEVSRGEINRETAGIAAAFMAAQTLQGNAKFDNNYAKFCQSVGQSVLEIMQANFTSPRELPIVGENEEEKLRKFTGDELKLVNRIIVKPGNAATRTTAQKMNIAQMMTQIPGAIANPRDLMTVIDTGQLNKIRAPSDTQRLLANEENATMKLGQSVKGNLGDDHIYHISSHIADVLGSVEARQNPLVAQALDPHLLWHVDQITRNPQSRAMNVLMKFVDPALLIAADQVTLPLGGGGPPPGPEGKPPGPGAPPPPMPQEEPGLPQQTGEILQGAEELLQNEAQKADMATTGA